MELDRKTELHEAFWRREAPRPLLGFFLERDDQAPPVRHGLPAIDYDTPVDDVVRKYRAVAQRATSEPGDRIPAVRVNYGTALLPALAGAGYRHDGHTAWAIPVGKSAADIEVPELNADAPIWQSYQRKLRALVEAELPAVMVTFGCMSGPMEMLLGLLGPEQLFLDVHDCPHAVVERSRECVRLWQQAFELNYATLGRPAGTVGFGVYVPGRSCLWAEDALALAGPNHFDRFFREGIRRIASHLDTSFLHTHSAGIASYPRLRTVRELCGVEISNDPNGPPLERIVEEGAAFQQAGKSVMFSNWKKPLTEEQVDYLLKSVDPACTVLTLTVEDRTEAERYMRRVAERFA